MCPVFAIYWSTSAVQYMLPAILPIDRNLDFSTVACIFIYPILEGLNGLHHALTYAHALYGSSKPNDSRSFVSSYPEKISSVVQPRQNRNNTHKYTVSWPSDQPDQHDPPMHTKHCLYGRNSCLSHSNSTPPHTVWHVSNVIFIHSSPVDVHYLDSAASPPLSENKLLLKIKKS